MREIMTVSPTRIQVGFNIIDEGLRAIDDKTIKCIEKMMSVNQSIMAEIFSSYSISKDRYGTMYHVELMSSLHFETILAYSLVESGYEEDNSDRQFIMEEIIRLRNGMRRTFSLVKKMRSTNTINDDNSLLLDDEPYSKWFTSHEKKAELFEEIFRLNEKEIREYCKVPEENDIFCE